MYFSGTSTQWWHKQFSKSIWDIDTSGWKCLSSLCVRSMLYMAKRTTYWMEVLSKTRGEYNTYGNMKIQNNCKVRVGSKKGSHFPWLIGSFRIASWHLSGNPVWMLGDGPLTTSITHYRLSIHAPTPVSKPANPHLYIPSFDSQQVGPVHTLQSFNWYKC